MRALLESQELRELRVSFLNAFGGVPLVLELAGREIASVEDLADLPALLLLDVVHVGVSEEEDAPETQREVTLRGIVELVGLVPVGERSRVLVRVRSLLACLELTLNATPH